MSDSAPASKISFWKESWPEIKKTIKEEKQWLLKVWFAVSLIYVLVFSGPTFLTPGTGVSPWIKLPATLLGLAAILLSIYLSYIVALRRAHKANPPQASIGNFFYWIWACFCKNFLFILSIAIPEFLVITCIRLLKQAPAGSKTVVGMLVLIVGIVGLLYVVTVALRLSLVSVLAIMGEKSFIKKSFRLTKGYCWRIFCGGLTLMLVLVGGFLVPVLVLVALAAALGKASVVVGVFMALLHGAWIAICGMFGAVYTTTVYDVILRKNLNPVLSQA